MSAAEVIELIKKLPPEEQAEVRDFLRADEASPKQIKYASDEAFARASKRIFAENKELLRRLAQ